MLSAEALIAVTDVEASSAWFQQILGVTSNHGGPYYDQLVDGSGRSALHLVRWGGSGHPSTRTRPDSGVGAGFELYVRYDTDEDLKSAVDRVRVAGAEVLVDHHYSELAHQEQLTLLTPDGYVLTLCGPVR